MIESLETRFTDHSLLVQKMIALIPSEIKDSNWEDIQDSAKFYADLLAISDEEEVEYKYFD